MQALAKTNRRYVLVADEYPEIRRVIRIILNRAGYEVLEAANGTEALALMNGQEDSTEMAAVICDVSLLMDNGIQAIDAIRRKRPLIPIVGFAGTTDLHMGHSSLFKGIVDYLVEPLETGLLIEAVNKAVAAPNMHSKVC